MSIRIYCVLVSYIAASLIMKNIFQDLEFVSKFRSEDKRGQEAEKWDIPPEVRLHRHLPVVSLQCSQYDQYCPLMLHWINTMPGSCQYLGLVVIQTAN